MMATVVRKVIHRQQLRRNPDLDRDLIHHPEGQSSNLQPANRLVALEDGKDRPPHMAARNSDNLSRSHRTATGNHQPVAKVRTVGEQQTSGEINRHSTVGRQMMPVVRNHGDLEINVDVSGLTTTVQDDTKETTHRTLEEHSRPTWRKCALDVGATATLQVLTAGQNQSAVTNVERSATCKKCA